MDRPVQRSERNLLAILSGNVRADYGARCFASVLGLVPETTSQVNYALLFVEFGAGEAHPRALQVNR